MECNLLIVPLGIRTDRPLHFSVKNMVPSFKNDMSHGNSSLPTATSVVKTGAAAYRPLDATKLAPTNAALNKVMLFINAPGFFWAIESPVLHNSPSLLLKILRL